MNNFLRNCGRIFQQWYSIIANAIFIVLVYEFLWFRSSDEWVGTFGFILIILFPTIALGFINAAVQPTPKKVLIRSVYNMLPLLEFSLLPPSSPVSPFYQPTIIVRPMLIALCAYAFLVTLSTIVGVTFQKSIRSANE